VKVLITGSSGTIGTRLWEALLPRCEVVGVDIRPNNWLAELDAKTLRVDLRNPGEYGVIPGDCDIVIHLAANARVYELVKDPAMALDNIVMSFHVMEFIRKQGIKRVVFASSRETYGNIMDNGPIAEDMVRLENCESPYSASKLSTEALVHAYRRVYGIDSVITRFSNVYGMYDDSDRVLPLWMKQALNGEDLVVFGGEKTLDFTYIDDTIDGIIRIIDRFETVKENTLNLACGQAIKLTTVAENIRDLLDKNINISILDNRPGEVWKYQADIGKARKLLGFQPKVSIDEGLALSAEWYKKFYNGR
jgi:nucleoside-diphosphate-sugar epimerase